MAVLRCVCVLVVLTLALAGPAASLQPREEFLGVVIFARGGQVVAELSGSPAERERLIVVGTDLRRKGSARVLHPLSPDTYLIDPLDGASPAVGDRLARETEEEAAARVFRANLPEDYREFLEFYPKSAHRPRVGRELFRLAMASAFPGEGGTVVSGRVLLAEETGREVSLDKVPVILDRYQFPGSGADGSFRLEGIPPLEEPAVLRVRVREPRLVMDAEVQVTFPAGGPGEVAVDLPVRVTPTILAGQVVDGQGNALPGAEVWTTPATTETLSDDDGGYRISRRKVSAGGSGPGDEPLFGGDFEVYARRKGYGVERVAVSAESYLENPVPELRLLPQDAQREDLPDLGVDLRAHLWVSTLSGAPQ